MAVRRRFDSLVVTRVDLTHTTPQWRRRPDELIVEEPLTIHLDGHMVATTMRTPGHDYELAVGHCFTEGLLGGASVEEVRYCATGSALDTGFNVVSVSTGGRAPVPTPRLGVTSSSCGLCGTEEIDIVLARVQPLDPDHAAAVTLEFLAGVPGLVAPQQPLFEATGAVHGAAAVTTDGEVICVREDVGRHNALDKVVGRLVLDGAVPARGVVAYVSGRASFELVSKAWAAGFAALVAVSAPTALAVHTARRAGLILAGFVRADAMNLYSPERWDAPR
jgi:FdhD protein